MAAFPAQWHDLMALTTPPNGFSSQPWWNDKAVRKQHWEAWGLDSSLVVPTLFHTYVDTEYVYAEGEPPFIEDAFGELALAWHEPQIVHTPHDNDCKAKLQQILQSHTSFVLKPIEGNRAEGVQLVVQAEPHTASDDFNVTVRRHTSEAKLIKSKHGERLPFSDWFEQFVIRNHQIKKGILVEPLIAWDNEVTAVIPPPSPSLLLLLLLPLHPLLLPLPPPSPPQPHPPILLLLPSPADIAFSASSPSPPLPLPFLTRINAQVTCISLAGGHVIVMGSKGGGLVRSGFAEACVEC